jgi:hypothetical protein
MSSRKLLFKHFNYPLFVPEPYRGILAVLAERGTSGMMSELERLSSLGSAWASATLGYLSLLPSASGVRDPQRALDLCSKAASSGDAYALFVTSWARYLLTKDRPKAAEPMLQASRMAFSPAQVAMSFYVWPDTKTAMYFLDEAERLGNKAAWSLRCGFYITGRLGFVRQIAGYFFSPFSRLSYFIAVLRNPLSEDVLCFNLTDMRPACRLTRREWRLYKREHMRV